MSEYQYYEFQAIDRPLNDVELKAVSSLSSRVNLSPNRAIFVYNFGDFRGDPVKVLEKYFDALLYLANWSTRQLVFRFPNLVVDTAAWEPYCFREDEFGGAVAFRIIKDHIILDICYREDGGFDDWIEGEGWLNSLSFLRQDIMNGDLRALYLAWLGSLYYLDVDDEKAGQTVEPPVPTNLKKLSKPLKDFIEFFGINDDLVTAASEASPDEAEVELNVEELIAQLPEQEKNNFLISLAKGDPGVSVQLARRLRDLSATKSIKKASDGQRRTVNELMSLANEKEKKRKERKRKDAERDKIKRLKELSEKQPELWKEVIDLIEKKKTKAYDEAVKILVELNELDNYLGEQERFKKNMDDIYERYSNRSALTSQLKLKKLI